MAAFSGTIERIIEKDGLTLLALSGRAGMYVLPDHLRPRAKQGVRLEFTADADLNISEIT